MATTGKAAWSKYFNTGKDIPSVLKKASKVFDSFTICKHAI